MIHRSRAASLQRCCAPTAGNRACQLSPNERQWHQAIQCNAEGEAGVNHTVTHSGFAYWISSQLTWLLLQEMHVDSEQNDHSSLPVRFYFCSSNKCHRGHIVSLIMSCHPWPMRIACCLHSLDSLCLSFGRTR